MNSIPTGPGEQLRAWRIEMGMSQRQLASILHVPPPTLSKWEAGQTRIRHWEMLKRAISDIGVEYSSTSHPAPKAEPGELDALRAEVRGLQIERDQWRQTSMLAAESNSMLRDLLERNGVVDQPG